MTISAEARAQHHRWLLEVTQIPTAAGREGRVIAWIRRWLAERPELTLSEDAAGNLHVSMDGTRAGEPSRGRGDGPVFFTAHLDHPAFVVEEVLGAGRVRVQFRGGVMDDYFADARITIHAEDGGRVGATLAGAAASVRPAVGDKCFIAELDTAGDGAGSSARVRAGDVATWELPAAEITGGLIHTSACDDLAALAAALAAYDVLRAEWRASAEDGTATAPDVRLLFTRAEEIGFIGAIAACRGRTMPAGSRVIALENSRSFEESPIGGGPIVRVGDRLSVFSPTLTGAIAKRAEDLAGAPATPTASQKQSQMPQSKPGGWKWQRKLMPGGACEATVFQAYGYEATCLCLPLGNYHNMADLAAVQAGTNTTRPSVAREFVSVSDFDGLVDLLVACGRELPAAAPVMGRIEKLWNDKREVLEE